VYFDSLFKESSSEITLEIKKATIDTRQLEFINNELTYDGNYHGISDIFTPEEISISYSNNSYKNAGTHQVNVYYSYDTDNYNELMLPNIVELIINPRLLEVSLINHSNLVYDNTSKEVSFEILNKVSGDSLNLSLINNIKTIPGNYVVTISGLEGESKNNYTLPKVSEYNWIINKADINGIELESNKEFIYDKTPKGILVNTNISAYNDELIVYYSVSPTTQSNGTDAGVVNYQATLIHPYYNTLVLYENFTINKRDIEVVLTNQEGTYGNISINNKAYIINNIIEGDTLSINILKESGTNIGIYQLTGILTIEPANYNVSFVSATYEIIQRSLTIKISNQSIPYSKLIPSINQTLYQITDGDIYSYDQLNINLSIINPSYLVGEYQIEGTYSNQNYDITFESGILFINKKEIHISFNNTVVSKIYDKIPYVYDYSINGLLDNDSVIVEFDKYNLINAGFYTVSIVGIDSDSYYLSYTNNSTLQLTINKAYVKLVIENKESVFNKDELDLTYLLFDINNNEISINDLLDPFDFVLKRDKDFEHKVGYAYPIRLSNTSVLEQQNYFVDFNVTSDYGIYYFTEEIIDLELNNNTYIYNGDVINLDFKDSDYLHMFDFSYYIDSIKQTNIINSGTYHVVATLSFNYIFNYKLSNSLSSFEFDVIVDKKDITDKIIINDTLPYTGLELTSFDITFSDFKYYMYETSSNKKVIGVGVYTIMVTITEDNYKGYLEYQLTITKIENPNRVPITYDSIIVDTNSITIPSNNLLEYSLDNQNYSPTSYYNNLISGSTHIVYIRFKESNQYYFSQPSTYIIEIKDYDNLFDNIVLLKEFHNILDAHQLLYETYQIITGINVNLSSEKTKSSIIEFEVLVNAYNTKVNEIKENSTNLNNNFSFNLVIISSTSFNLLGIALKIYKKRYLFI
jgi:hypothetical protein